MKSRSTLKTLLMCAAIPLVMGANDCQEDPLDGLSARIDIDMVYANLQPVVPPDPVRATFTGTYANDGASPIILGSAFDAELVNTEGDYYARMTIYQITDEEVILDPGESQRVPYEKGRVYEQRGEYPCGDEVYAIVYVEGSSGGASSYITVRTDPAQFGCVY